MDLGLQGKTALVCAASKGLGKACAVSLAREGVDVTIVARTPEPLVAAAEEIRAGGSNFPNALWTPKLTYSEHLRIFTEALPLSDDAKAQVLGQTARRLWFPDLRV